MAKSATQHLEITALPGEGIEEAKARAAVTPTMAAAGTVQRYAQVGGIDLTALSKELTRQAKAVQSGDLSRAENMLTAQAHTLDAIFTQLAARAANAEYLPQLETFLKLALRAQSQARATWGAIASIQHPPLANYINQANIAAGHQQVNNGSRARETEKVPTQQLEEINGNRLDFGTKAPAGSADPQVATVGEINRPQDT